MSEGVLLTLRFDKPGFFVNDARVTVDLNGERIYDGSFLSGFEVSRSVLPGEHWADFAIESGPLRRTRRYRIAVPSSRGLVATVRYSRMWGNFKKQPLYAPY